MWDCPRPAPAAKIGTAEACGQNTNDHYIKHPPAHFDQNALKPQQALPLLTSEFINPVGVTARKHKIHRPPCSLSDLTVCLSAPPSLPDCSSCSLLQHSRWDNCTRSQYDAPGAAPVTALISPIAPLCTHPSVMIVMVSKWFAVNMSSPQEVAVCVWARTNTWKRLLLSFSTSGLRTTHCQALLKSSVMEGRLPLKSLKAAALLHCAAGTLARNVMQQCHILTICQK